jgi:hypothetical protein
MNLDPVNLQPVRLFDEFLKVHFAGLNIPLEAQIRTPNLYHFSAS